MLKIDISEKEDKALIIAGGTLLDISGELTYAIKDILPTGFSGDKAGHHKCGRLNHNGIKHYGSDKKLSGYESR